VVGAGTAVGAYGRPVKVRARLTAAANSRIRPGVTLRIVAAVPGERIRIIRVGLR
jgi:hypothetical protein